jgi:hypothetical protein
MKNDFADRLLGRTAAPAVRPLLPSFFEPVAGSTAQWAAPMGAVTETAAPTTSAGPSASRTPVQPDPDAPGVPSVTPVRASETPLLPANPTPIGSPLAEVRTVHVSRRIGSRYPSERLSWTPRLSPHRHRQRYQLCQHCRRDIP